MGQSINAEQRAELLQMVSDMMSTLEQIYDDLSADESSMLPDQVADDLVDLQVRMATAIQYTKEL